MIRRLAACCLIAAATATPALARELVCSRAAPKISVVVRAGEPTIDATRTRIQLTEESRHLLPGNAHTLGLYNAIWRMSAQRQLGTLTESNVPQPRACVRLDSVEVTIEIDTRTIFVARELNPGSCRHAAVFEHERKHQAVDDDVLRRNAPWLRQLLARDLTGLFTVRPIRARDLEASQARFVAESDRVINAAWKTINDERERLQREIDTPEEYARVNGACR